MPLVNGVALDVLNAVKLDNGAVSGYGRLQLGTGNSYLASLYCDDVYGDLKTGNMLQVGGLGVGGSGSPGTGQIMTRRATVTDNLLILMRTGETYNRFAIQVDGTQKWGDGAGSVLDTNLYRAAANVLATDDALVTGEATSKRLEFSVDRLGGGQAAISFGASADTNLYRRSAANLQTDSTFWADQVVSNLGIYLGNGLDTRLYRDSAAVVAINGSLKFGDGTVQTTAANLSVNVMEPLDYQQFTTDVFINNIGSEAAAVQVVAASALTFDGTTPALIEFWCPGVAYQGGSSNTWRAVLYDGSTSLGMFNPTRANMDAAWNTPVTLQRRLTPSAGSHTYSVRFWCEGSSTQIYIRAGTGGSGQNQPGFIRVSRQRQQSYVTPAGAVGYGTSLPGSPTDGQEFILTDSTTSPTWRWRLRYNASSSSAYKWEFLGGTPLFSEVATAETTSSATYADMTTVGPSVTLPIAGDYEVAIGGCITPPFVAGALAYMSYAIGATAAVDADAIRTQINDTNQPRVTHAGSRFRVKTGLTAVALMAKYRTSSAGNATNVGERWMRVTPVRIG